MFRKNFCRHSTLQVCWFLGCLCTLYSWLSTSSWSMSGLESAGCLPTSPSKLQSGEPSRRSVSQSSNSFEHLEQ